MKKILVLGLMLVGLLVQSSETKAQVSLNLNIGSQPLWGPVGYDYAEYYYMPEIDVFYDVPRRQYVYLDGSRWLNSYELPGRYRNYDLYRGYKVVINEPTPWMRWNYYHDRYYSSRSWHDRQVIIRDSRDPRYYVVPGHPYYGNRKYDGIARRDYDKWDNQRRDYDRRYDNRYDNRRFDDRRFDNRYDNRYDNRGRDWNNRDNGGSKGRGHDKSWKDNDHQNRGRGKWNRQ